MSEFIHFEAEVNSESDLSDNDENIDNDLDNFIVSDENVTQDPRSFYRGFENVENDLDEILRQSSLEAYQDLDNFDEINNLDEDDEIEREIDDFPSAKNYLLKFEKTLKPETNNQICNVIIKALAYQMKGEENVPQTLIKQIKQPEKFKFIVDQQYSFNMCYELTMILSQFGYFLRVFELKKKNTDIYF